MNYRPWLLHDPVYRLVDHAILIIDAAGCASRVIVDREGDGR